MPPKDADDIPATLGEGSAIRLGLGIVLAGWVALSSWWASAINSKLNVVVNGQQSNNADVVTLRQKIEALERVSDQFTQFGSPALRVRIDVLEKFMDKITISGCPKAQELDKHLTALEMEFEKHKAKP